MSALELLMVSPEYFTISYAINPHMLDESGKLKKVDEKLAQKQWLELKTTFERLGARVHVLPGQPGLPDMVYAANQSVVYKKNGVRTFCLSEMKSPERKAEVSFFKSWFREQGFQECAVTFEGCFEGNGDLIWDEASQLFWAGHGFRTELSNIERFQRASGVACVPLQLVSDLFYHLDTCFLPLGSGVAAYHSKAFSKDAQSKLRERFPDLIDCDLKEAKENFCLNALRLGNHVVVHQGSSRFNHELSRRGFQVHEVDTSEFIKAGGSVFCMKLELP